MSRPKGSEKFGSRDALLLAAVRAAVDRAGGRITAGEAIRLALALMPGRDWGASLEAAVHRLVAKATGAYRRPRAVR